MADGCRSLSTVYCELQGGVKGIFHSLKALSATRFRLLLLPRADYGLF